MEQARQFPTRTAPGMAASAPLLQDPERRAERARLAGHALTLLQRAPIAELEATLPQALGLLGKAMQACRGFVVQFDPHTGLHNAQEWCADTVPSAQAMPNHLSYADGSVFWRHIERSGLLAIADLNALHHDAPLRQLLDGHDICALIACPLWQDHRIAGFVALEFTKDRRDFDTEDELVLRSFAACVSVCLQHRKAARDAERSQAALRMAQARLSAAVARGPKLLVETDASGIIAGFFQSDPIIFALNPTEVIGAAPEHVLPGHVADIVRKAMADVNRQGYSAIYTYALDLVEGVKWYHLSATSRDPRTGAAPSGYLFVVTEVTEARKQELQIRQLVRVAELSTNLILLTDKSWNVTWANPETLARTGLALADTLGRNARQVLNIPADGWADSQPGAALSLTMEVKASGPSGAEYWLELNVQSLRDETDDVQGYMIVGVDVTAHKLAEARALRDKMRTLDAASDGYAMIWPDGRVGFMNAELRRLLHFPSGTDPEGLLWTDLAGLDLAKRLPEILPLLLGTGFWQGEVTRTIAGQPDIHADVSLSVQEDGSIFVVARDVTARKQVEAERASLQARLLSSQSRLSMSQMAAGLAHDLANLMSVITGSVLVAEAEGSPAARPALGRIRQASAQAQNLVSTLRDLGKAVPRREQVHVLDAARRTAGLLQPGLHSRLELVAREDSLPAITADATQVMQVLVNLVMNADQANQCVHPAPGSARIFLEIGLHEAAHPAPPLILGQLEAGHRYITTVIRDQGPGIPEAERARIFAPFVTGWATRGTGLGLAIVAEIVKSHRAGLQVSTSAGAGTALTLYWPVALPADMFPAQPREGSDDKPLTGLNVLIVDDDDRILQTVSDLLTRAGAETTSCANPRDALGALQQDPDIWDVIVTDYEMRPMTGLDLGRAIRKINPHLKIVLVTGSDLLQNATDAVKNLPGAILRKPVHGPELIAVLLHEKLRHRASESKK